MKVLHILYSGLGGVFNVVDTLINKKTIDVNNGVLYVGPKLSKDGKEHKKVLKKNFFYVKTIKSFSIFYFIQNLIKILCFKPDIIVLHNYQILPCIFSRLFLNLKIIYVDHKPLSTKSLRDTIVIKLSKIFVKHYVVLNRDNYNFFLNKLNIHSSKISIIENGINLKMYGKKNKKTDIINIGMAGRMNSSKFQNILIEAVQSLIKKGINIRCYLAGDGENKIKLINQTKNTSKIIFNGALSQKKLREWFSNLNLYVQATKGEAFSVSIIQAMASGVPVIASNVTGINNIKLPYIKKFLFKNNAKDLEKNIRKFLLISKKAKRKIIKNQYSYLKNKNSQNFMCKNYLRLYNRIFENLR